MGVGDFFAAFSSRSHRAATWGNLACMCRRCLSLLYGTVDHRATNTTTTMTMRRISSQLTCPPP